MFYDFIDICMIEINCRYVKLSVKMLLGRVVIFTASFIVLVAKPSKRFQAKISDFNNTW